MADVIDDMRADIKRCGCPEEGNHYCVPCDIQRRAIEEIIMLRFELSLLKNVEATRKVSQ